MQRNIMILLFFLILGSGLHSNNSQVSDVSSQVSKAIREGNAKSIAQYFGSHVDLTLPGNDGTFSKSQGELILREFFNKNAPSQFTVSHEGTSRDGSHYLIGRYVATNGSSFRTYLLVKNVSGKMIVQQLQFENR